MIPPSKTRPPHSRKQGKTNKTFLKRLAVDVLCASSGFLVGVIDIGVRGLGALQLEDPGAVFELIGGVEIGIVTATGVPHLAEDFEPALT